MNSLALSPYWQELAGRTWLGNELWRWATLLAVAGAMLLAAKLVVWALRHRARARTGRPMLASALRSATAPVWLMALASMMYAAGALLVYPATQERHAPLAELEPFSAAVRAAAVLAVAWLAMRLLGAVEAAITAAVGPDERLGRQLAPPLRKFLRAIVMIVAVLFIVQNVFGWDIGSVLTGLGLGGLAFALAARDMLANLFGTVTIFTDRPFAIGDRVIVRGHNGLVQDVGFRSTRLLKDNGSVVVIPNSIIANEPVENLSRISDAGKPTG